MSTLEKKVKELEEEKTRNSATIAEKGKEVADFDNKISGEQAKIEENKRNIQNLNTDIERTKEAKQNYEEAKKAGNPPQGVIPNFDEIIENSKKQIQEKEQENTNIQNKIAELSNKKEQAKKDAID